MAQLWRPLMRQWPWRGSRMPNHCCGISLHHLLSSPCFLEPAKPTSFTHFSLVPLVSSSNRNLHFRSGSLRFSDDAVLQDGADSDESSADVKKSRNQLKREAKRAVRWGMELASFSAPQIKRILRVVSVDREVFEALMLVKRLRPDVREGRRRQFNYIGKLLREVQPELMDKLIEATKDGNHSELQKLCGSDSEVLEGDDELTEFEPDEDDEDSDWHVARAVRWFDGLVNKDVKITNEVYSLQEVEFDRQSFK
ncbi:uncharacterized protein LOC114739841 isoform X2 [Neltuma alba]|uniref:uncharacterized protein LOC114739841 isoform X2 n=1 Tax=Neltuma alba TaxID=207710 RepID=UPI0010A31E08|nr:uncharacterized protein LOC114739841 isoform X2 [Prosopis alba]